MGNNERKSMRKLRGLQCINMANAKLKGHLFNNY
ncbi:hypothetical protein T4D_12831 [Trichinella pseudospiralis]|uniref:Uncharacterized protein n=1 Tax=Trichinella pseudospiralis TaxID=6337 RepID=A0A0V1DK51_TRIPS|nr:hypothetical protein T4D_12831 [Trichinella pseudospiralis]